MLRLCLDIRRKVILLHSTRFSVSKANTRLSVENADITQQSLYCIIKKFQQTNQYKDLHQKKQEKKITPEIFNGHCNE